MRKDNHIKFKLLHLKVIEMICDGFCNKEIATKLNIGLRTVEGIKADVFQKLEVNCTAKMVVKAIQLGIYKVIISESYYNYETMELIYKMVHDEQLTFQKIAYELNTHSTKIESIYKESLKIFGKPKIVGRKYKS